MRILFCNDSFPGNFEALAGLLAADSANEVLFLSTFVRKDFSIPGVSRVRLRLNRDKGGQEKDAFFLSWEKAYRIGRQTAHTLLHVRESGFVPDMILASSADGPGLFLRHVFPESFIVSYFDRWKKMPETKEERDRLKASLSLQSYQMGQSNLYFILSEWQRRLFPPMLQKAVRVMPCFVDTDFFSSGACTESRAENMMKSDELLVFHIKEQRGEPLQHCLSVIADVLSFRPQCRAALCTGRESIRQAWERAISQWPESLRPRISVELFGSLKEYRDFLCAATLHIFPDASAAQPHELLECMSCGSLLMVPRNNAHSDFLNVGKNCLEWPDSSIKARTEAVCSALDMKDRLSFMSSSAREVVSSQFSQKVVLPEHVKAIKKEYDIFNNIKILHDV